MKLFADKTDTPEPANAMLDEHGIDFLLELLPVGVYVCDRDGQIIRYNRAAAELWGRSPQIGDPALRFCGSWRLLNVDGTPVLHSECPMAVALATGDSVRDQEIVVEHPDKSRIAALVSVKVLRDAGGDVTGAVGMLADITGRKTADEAAQRLAAIVESSDDAILSKDLNGIITSWNNGAEHLYGYKAHEVIGKPVLILIPEDRHDEEPVILSRIRQGERINHYETVRRRKDGTLIDISLTVSPIRNAQGRIVGASKIARDITERRQAEERQRLLLREMNHRVKNLFTLSSSLVTLSARSAGSTEELISGVRERFAALAQAHTLTLPQMWNTAVGEGQTTLHALIRSILLPFEGNERGSEPRAVIAGPDLPLSGTAVTNFALLLHEFATNAAKYGALSVPEGRVDIACSEDGDQFTLTWRERGGPPIESEPTDEGFGTLLTRATIKGALGGRITREWRPEGLMIMLSVMRDQATAR